MTVEGQRWSTYIVPTASQDSHVKTATVKTATSQQSYHPFQTMYWLIVTSGQRNRHHIAVDRGGLERVVFVRRGAVADRQHRHQFAGCLHRRHVDTMRLNGVGLD